MSAGRGSVDGIDVAVSSVDPHPSLRRLSFGGLTLTLPFWVILIFESVSGSSAVCFDGDFGPFDASTASPSCGLLEGPSLFGSLDQNDQPDDLVVPIGVGDPPVRSAGSSGGSRGAMFVPGGSAELKFAEGDIVNSVDGGPSCLFGVFVPYHI